MLEQLKKEVYEANMDLVAKGMVIYTWGNVSGIDREKGLVSIRFFLSMLGKSDRCIHQNLYMNGKDSCNKLK